MQIRNYLEYECKACGCSEFISKPNRYDIFRAIDNKLVLVETKYIEEELKLYCRDCSIKLEFNHIDELYEK